LSKIVERQGHGRRKEDGTCLFHCRLKQDVQGIEDKMEKFEHRISAMEPVTEHNQKEIDSMRKLQLATLATGIFCLLGIIASFLI
jgi:hypothetical protein